MESDHRELLGRDVVACDGARIGDVADVYVDATSGVPKWLVVRGGLLSNGISFVPAEGAREDGSGRLVVAPTRRQVRRAPHPSAQGELSVDEEEALTRHYSAVDHDQDHEHHQDHHDDLSAGFDSSQDDPEAAVVRSEEELQVSTTTRPAGRARLVKRIVTEEVTITVPLRREVLELVSDDVAPEALPGAGTTVSEPFAPMADLELVLYEEVVEYSKRIVPKERVRLVKQVVEELVDVRADLRKERVDVEQSDGRTDDLRAPVRPST